MTPSPSTEELLRLDALLKATIEDCGDPDDFPEDEGPIGATQIQHGPIENTAVTFKIIREAREALAALRTLPRSYTDEGLREVISDIVEMARDSITDNSYCLSESEVIENALAAMSRLRNDVRTVPAECRPERVLYYLKSIQGMVDAQYSAMVKANVAVEDVQPGPTLGLEVAADNRDWLDCYIDWLERRIALPPSTTREREET